MHLSSPSLEPSLLTRHEQKLIPPTLVRLDLGVPPPEIGPPSHLGRPSPEGPVHAVIVARPRPVGHHCENRIHAR